MGLYKHRPEPSGSMGALWTLSTIKNAAVLEFGAMGHMVDARITLEKAGICRTCGMFSTHIDDIDITLGGVERVKASVDYILKNSDAKAVFLLPSAVPEIIGTDFAALAEELRPTYPGTDIIDFNFSGLTTTLNKGVEETLLTLARRLAGPGEKSRSYNIIGSCADFVRFYADAEEIVRIMRGAFRMEPGCILTSSASVDDIKKMGGASLNIVIRKEGLAAAEYLEEKFGVPYYFGRPYGLKGTMKWIRSLGDFIGASPDEGFLADEYAECDRNYDMFHKLYRRMKFYGSAPLRLSASSHSDVVGGVASFADELGFEKDRFWCVDSGGSSGEIPFLSEAEWENMLPDLAGDVLMASGDVLAASGRDQGLLLSHPHGLWSICPYDAPFVGFRGTVNLICTWVGEIQKRS